MAILKLFPFFENCNDSMWKGIPSTRIQSGPMDCGLTGLLNLKSITRKSSIILLVLTPIRIKRRSSNLSVDCMRFLGTGGNSGCSSGKSCAHKIEKREKINIEKKILLIFILIFYNIL